MAKGINSSSLICAERHQTSCLVDSDAVVLDTARNFYYGLNPVAARIWQLIQSPITFDEVVSRILEEYDVDKLQCSADCHEFLTALFEKNLIILD